MGRYEYGDYGEKIGCNSTHIESLTKLMYFNFPNFLQSPSIRAQDDLAHRGRGTCEIGRGAGAGSSWCSLQPGPGAVCGSVAHAAARGPRRFVWVRAIDPTQLRVRAHPSAPAFSAVAACTSVRCRSVAYFQD
ncbi:hypothetical protein EVAR_88474_1 [Eumeta japonica]|uniref:Uncharacterized protein n=1 Tax=Eumeta variegata TaxID=151549 RepID=A0A4C1XUW1_EUMVA|nr:hypothetical protein EVAR_88474_1 [Eumeta japonica]